MTADHEKLLNALLVQLNLQRAGLRKRAIQCLGNGLFHVVSYIIKNRIVITSFLSPYQTQLIAEKWMQIHCWHVLKQFHMDTCFMIGTGKGEQSPDEQNIGCSITCGQHVR
jgi:hypothetical protein